MIPVTNDILSTLEIEEQPSKNYKLFFTENIINGYADKLEAMKQVIYKILNTERYQCLIYSWNYGIETMDLFGEPVSYVCPEIQRRITEALLQDDRINSVDSFEFNYSLKGKLLVTFQVHTIYGDINEEKVVNY